MNMFVPKRILIVNANRLDMATLSQILLLNGYQLSCAESEAVALKVVRRAKPDLAICNAGSTKLDVVGFFRTVRSDAQTRGIPFLFITDAKEELQNEVGNLHSRHFLLKPYTREQLAISVQENLKH